MSSALLSKREPSPRPCLDGSTASTSTVPCRSAKEQVFIHLLSLRDFLFRGLCVCCRSSTFLKKSGVPQWHMPDGRKEDIPRTKEIVWTQPLPLAKGSIEASPFPPREPPLGRERGACLESNKKIVSRLTPPPCFPPPARPSCPTLASAHGSNSDTACLTVPGEVAEQIKAAATMVSSGRSVSSTNHLLSQIPPCRHASTWEYVACRDERSRATAQRSLC